MTKPTLPAAAEAPGVPFDHVMTILRGAADHLGRVMAEHPYCDHVHVVKAYGDVWRKMYGHVAAAPRAAQAEPLTDAEIDAISVRFDTTSSIGCRAFVRAILAARASAGSSRGGA